jgi:PAP2 superfamily
MLLRKFFCVVCLCLSFGTANAGEMSQEAVLATWYKLILNLVRHTATYSPPVASRNFAYLAVTAYEATASGDDHLISLQGQLRDLKTLPQREKGKAYDEALVLNAALDAATHNFFSNTGPTGQRVLALTSQKMNSDVSAKVANEVKKRSVAYGQKLAAAVFDWSKTDGGAVVENMGFPMAYDLNKAPGHWVPTSQLRLQQLPLLPNWGKNRTFAMPAGTTCNLPAPPVFSEDKTSEFFKQAKEVYDTKNSLTPDQKLIARFWSDDPMLSSTPPGHWIGIATEIIDRDKLSVAKSVDVMARLSFAVADGFIGCWNTKMQYDLLRPLTYIKKNIDPKWETLLITPPFPEYPSGHSTQSGAAAAVLTQFFGEKFGFDDATHQHDGFKPRHFISFWQAANEAGISRLYGGIHFRAAVDRGLEQGKCIGAYANQLKTVK